VAPKNDSDKNQIPLRLLSDDQTTQGSPTADAKKPNDERKPEDRPFLGTELKDSSAASFHRRGVRVRDARAAQKDGAQERNDFYAARDQDTPKKEPQPEEIRLQDRLEAIKKKEQELLARKKAKEHNLPYIDLTIAPIDTQAVWLVDQKQAEKAGLAVLHTLKKDGGGSAAQIALTNPENQLAQQILKKLTQDFSHLNVFIASPRSLKKAWARYLDSPQSEARITGQIEIEVDEIKRVQKQVKNVADLQKLVKKVSPQKASELLEVVIAGALQTEASDIHLEAREQDSLLRFRIDGVLQDVIFLPALSHHVLVNRIKLLSEMKLNRKDIAQDGRFTIAYGESKIEVRVSVIPAAYGENIVIRILNPKAISLGLKDLGFRDDELVLIQRELQRPNGMIITTGPTGSGKTTALYAFVRTVATKEKKVITLEDPVEYHLPQITQTQIEPDRGYTFAAGLRAILRQDPDIILVGEIRDKETAEIAIHAALTGHLLFSTLHTNDAAGAVPRLVEMGVNPAILSAALNNILAQRLVRRLCIKCKRANDNPADYQFVSEIIASLPPVLQKKHQRAKYEIFQPVGCPSCNNTGYRGRIGLFEIIHIDSDLEKLIAGGPSHAHVKEAAAGKHFTNMLQDGVIKIISGITSVTEVKSAVGQD